MASGDDSDSDSKKRPKQVTWEVELNHIDERSDSPRIKSQKTTKDSNSEFNAAIKAIGECQMELDKVNEQAALEVLEVERKYNKLRKPFFDKRQRATEQIPGFWYRALVGHPEIDAIVSKEENQCLVSLKKLEVEESEDIQSGYCIKFHFSENSFFENDVLIKQYSFLADSYSNVGTAIKWKPNMNLTKNAFLKRQQTKGGKSHLKIPASFFAWFICGIDPMDDYIADIIKDEIWSNPLVHVVDYNDGDDIGLAVIEEGEEIDSDDDDEVMELKE